MSGFVPADIRTLRRPGAPALPEKRSCIAPPKIIALVAVIALAILFVPSVASAAKEYLGKHLLNAVRLGFISIIVPQFILRNKPKPPPITPEPEHLERIYKTLNKCSLGSKTHLSVSSFLEETSDPEEYELNKRFFTSLEEGDSTINLLHKVSRGMIFQREYENAQRQKEIKVHFHEKVQDPKDIPPVGKLNKDYQKTPSAWIKFK